MIAAALVANNAAQYLTTIRRFTVPVLNATTFKTIAALCVSGRMNIVRFAFVPPKSANSVKSKLATISRTPFTRKMMANVFTKILNRPFDGDDMKDAIATWRCTRPEFPLMGTYTVDKKRWVMITNQGGGCGVWKNKDEVLFGHDLLPEDEENDFLDTSITLKGGPRDGLVMKYNTMIP